MGITSEIPQSFSTRAVVEADRVIDMGCADGLLLPSLAKAYGHVMAIDVNEDFVARSQRLIQSVKLENVQALSSAGLSIVDV